MTAMNETKRLPLGARLGRSLMAASLLGVTALVSSAQASGAHAAASQDSGGEVEMIRFRSGTFQWGMVEDHSPENVSFKRLDNGGLVTVPWSMIEEAQSLEMRTLFGYVDITGDEILVAAEMLVLADGREIIGLVQGRTDNAILYLTQGKQLQIPKSLVRNHLVGLQVPALDVYTKDHLYQEEERKSDLESAESQYELAEFCERILDYPRALEHYQAASELDATFKAKELPIIIERVQVKVDSQEQVDALSYIDHLKRRKRFDEAFTQLAAFDANFLESPLRGERLKMEDRVIKAREDYMRTEVSKAWFSWMSRLATKAAREMSFDSSLSYLEEGFGGDIARNVTETMRKQWLDLEEDQVRQFFIERKAGRWKPASYGLGTWLLGEEDALKGGPAAEAEQKPQSARDKERAAQAEKINRWLRNQEMAKRSRKSEDDLDEIEKAWSILSVPARRNWMIAYYAENSGELMVRPTPELRNCSECGGTGVREIILTGGAREGDKSGRQAVHCPTCHGIGRVRRIRFR